MPSNTRILAGAMSGTSADGVDVALVQIEGSGLEMSAKVLRHHHRPYDDPLKSSIFRIRERDNASLGELAQLARNISLCYATATNEALLGANLSARDIAAVAAHGQTLYHNPPDTIQWFDPALVASEVGCAVVSDFRRADCAAGGQGAPLVPFADYILFRHPTKNRVLLNIGGIANITWLKAGGAIDDVIAFDTGPGNCVSDHYARRAGLTDGIDRDGTLAMTVASDFTIASIALRNWKKVFMPPPKSTDVPEMLAAYELAIEQLKKRDQPTPVHLASACTMCALGVSLALRHLNANPDEILIGGGGAENAAMMRELRAIVRIPFVPTSDLGVPCQAREAIAFALLGAATLDGIPSNVPSVTGAKRAVVLGSITPKP